MNWIELNWIEIELNWIELNWSDLKKWTFFLGTIYILWRAVNVCRTALWVLSVLRFGAVFSAVVEFVCVHSYVLYAVMVKYKFFVCVCILSKCAPWLKVEGRIVRPTCSTACEVVVADQVMLLWIAGHNKSAWYTVKIDLRPILSAPLPSLQYIYIYIYICICICENAPLIVYSAYSKV